MITVYVYAVKFKYPVYDRSSFMDFLRSFANAIPGLMTPLIILGGITFGWFTPTEASAIAVLYTMALGFINKSINIKEFGKILSETARLAGISLFCVGTASAFSWLLSYHKVPLALVNAISSYSIGTVGITLIIAAIFLIVGLFIDAIPAIIIMGGVLYPIALEAGIHPIHFSIIGVVALGFGLVTPPYGLCLLIAARIGEEKVHNVLKDVIIILLPMFLILFLICLIPEISLYLPRLITPQFM